MSSHPALTPLRPGSPLNDLTAQPTSAPFAPHSLQSPHKRVYFCAQDADRPACIFFFFFARSNVCVKWQNMNQVTGRGGRLGHLSGPGEGVLKQKAAPGFQGKLGLQLFHHQTLPNGLLSNEMWTHRCFICAIPCCHPVSCISLIGEADYKPTFESFSSTVSHLVPSVHLSDI